MLCLFPGVHGARSGVWGRSLGLKFEEWGCCGSPEAGQSLWAGRRGLWLFKGRWITRGSSISHHPRSDSSTSWDLSFGYLAAVSCHHICGNLPWNGISQPTEVCACLMECFSCLPSHLRCFLCRALFPISSVQIRGAFLLSSQYLHFIPQQPLRAGLHLVFCPQRDAGVAAVSCGSCELI